MIKNIFDLGINHDCLTGNCQHEYNSDCIIALGLYIGLLCKEGKSLQQKEREASK